MVDPREPEEPTRAVDDAAVPDEEAVGVDEAAISSSDVAASGVAAVPGEVAVSDGAAVTDEAVAVDAPAIVDHLADRLADPQLTAGETGGARSGRRFERRALLEIMALSGLVIAQPLLDITGRSPDFFLFYDAGAADILGLVAVLTLAPPLALWGIGLVTRLIGRRTRAAAHAVTVGLLLAALAVQVGKHLLPLRGTPLALLALAFGGGGLYAYRRWRASGQLLRVAAVGPLVFALLFVFTSPTAALLSGSRVAGAVAPAPGPHPPVVLLVLDELPLVSLLGPGGGIDARRFPNFARLSRQSTWYRNATAVSGDTPYALPAMLTGRYPERKQAPHYSRYPDNLFTLLDGIYDVRARETISQLCLPGRCAPRSHGSLPVLLRKSAALLQQVVSPTDAGADPQAGYREATRREVTQASEPSDPHFRFDALGANQPARFADFLADLRPADRPTVHFLHLLMPHTPWTYLPSGMRYDAPNNLVNDGDGWVSLAHQRHLAQLGYTDRLLGQTLRKLEESGLYDEALVVVTADHGVSFTPGRQGRQLVQARDAPAEVLWVPTFVKAPGQRTGMIDDRNWEQVDLLPTIADRVNVPVPWRTDGVSALAGARERVDKRYHGEPGEPVTIAGPENFRAVVTGRARPALPAAPVPDLIGRSTADLPVTDGTERATVHEVAAFATVDPASGRVPALVCGSAPASVPTGTRLAVALNGRIAAGTRVVDPDGGDRRFSALITDDSLFRAGENRLEIFAVTDEGLRRLRG